MPKDKKTQIESRSTPASKPKILIFCNYYLPGYKRGGGLRTLVNMVDRFHEKFEFKVVTNDHDGDHIQYKNVRIDGWNAVGNAEVFYLSKNNSKIKKMRQIIIREKPDVIYINSVFSTFSICLLLLRKFSLMPDIKIILAPEGELSDGALQLKSGKKKTFTKFVQKANLYRDLIWKTTSELEKEETERFKGVGGKIYIAPNLPAQKFLDNYRQEAKPKKESGTARMIFLSRYMRKKNFKWLVDNIKNIVGNLQIDIVAPLEDEEYWAETVAAMKNLPENFKIEYKGLVPYEKVLETIFQYQFFILPTLGENFGHVFIEALAAGCPLVISDRTPWLDLEEKQIGWDLPLENPLEWIEKINYCISLDDDAYRTLSANARRFANEWLADPKIEEDTLRVLQETLNEHQQSPVKTANS